MSTKKEHERKTTVSEETYDPEVKVTLKHTPYSSESTYFVLNADEISRRLRSKEITIGDLNSKMSHVREFLTEKLEAGDGADFDELVDLAQALDVEVTKSVNIRVDVQFEIEADIPVWTDASEWANDNLEFDLISDGRITYVNIEEAEEM